MLSCNKCSVLYGVLNFLMLYDEKYLNFKECQLLEKNKLNYKENI